MCAGMGPHGDSRHNRAIFVSSTGIGGKAKLGVSRPVDQGIFNGSLSSMHSLFSSIKFIGWYMGYH